ncbi:hypothetical protein AAMO2058_000261100 [Amorphochlora amoebiformis]
MKALSYACNIGRCQRRYLTEHKLKEHIRTWHANVDMYCDKCERSFFSSKSFSKHMAAHAQEYKSHERMQVDRMIVFNCRGSLEIPEIVGGSFAQYSPTLSVLSDRNETSEY